jgi:hypothetical protein
MLIANWESAEEAFDFDENGIVDTSDLLTMISNWGSCD